MIRSAITYDHLDELLRGDGRGGYVGLSAIDGLIAAVVAGPVQIEPATWLPPIVSAMSAPRIAALERG